MKDEHMWFRHSKTGKKQTIGPREPRCLLPDAVVGVAVTVGVTQESLPVQPAHCRSQREAIVQRVSGGTY